MDQIIETKNTGYFSRIAGGFKNIIGGIICLLIGIGLLRNNEGRAVQTQKSLEEGQKNVISVSSNSINGINNGKLIHFTGISSASIFAKDNDFGITTSGAIMIERKVETYQRTEESTTTTKDKVGGGQEQTTTYSYKKIWSENEIDSSNFKQQEGHINQDAKPYSNTVIGQDIKVGSFLLPNYLANKIVADTKIENLSGMIREDITLGYPTLKNYGDTLYIGKGTEGQPEIGDKKITFYVANPQIYSIIAKQDGSGVSEFQTNAGDAISIMILGNKTANEMFMGEIQSNKTLTRLMRGAGTLLIIIGFSLLFSLLGILSSLIPLIGNIVNFGTGIVSAILGGLLAMLIIALAWIRFRPTLGIGIIAIIIIILVLLSKKRK